MVLWTWKPICMTQLWGEGPCLKARLSDLDVELMLVCWPTDEPDVGQLGHRWTRCWAAGTPTSDSCSKNKGGWIPYWHSKGDIPIEERRRVLSANSAQIKCLLQCVGLDETRHLKIVSISWLVRSVCPLEWGWNVSGYVCNHGSPNGERDTASPRGRYGERPQRDSCLKIHM